jgi:TonB-linked SusC/RagA family outer membrane protein
MKIKILSILAALALLPLGAFAQNSLKGTVSDAQGPLAGVMILNKDNGKWTSTDLDGNYTIEQAAKGQTLEFTLLGYITRTEVWNGQSPFNIVLSEDAVELEETVVIGYGSVKKKDLTGAVGIINDKLISQQSTSQLSQSLQGAIPGLTVTRSSSMPGASATIKVRGITTMSDNDPLILVDGMAVSSLDNVATDDVRQITVLKDAASAAIYGARAAAGVILITTKEATEGQLQIGYNGEYSIITPTEFPEYRTGVLDYMNDYNEYLWNTSGNPAGGEYAMYSKEYIDSYLENSSYDPLTYPNYDWNSAILSKSSMRHKHNLTMTYGNKVIKSRTSAGYEKADALYPGSDHQRISLRSRNTIKFSDKWSGSLDFAFRNATKNDPQTGSPIMAANMYPSIYAGLYPDGRAGLGKTGAFSNTLAALLYGGYKKTDSYNLTGKISLSYKPFDGMDITANFTPTYSFLKTKSMAKAVPVYDAYDTDVLVGYVSGYNTNTLTEGRSDSKTFEKQFIATYDKTFAKNHTINLMAGYEDYSYTYETMSAGSNGMELSSFPYLNLANTNSVDVGGSSYQNAYRSVFGRVMYNYAGRYYLQLNARGDASSRFHKDHRWGFFPSASLGWVVTNENFMSNVNWLNHLKLRASLGSLGNERIGNYPYQTYISFNKAILYDASGTTATSAMTGAQADYAYQDISWEKTWSWDAGFDAAFFGNRLDITADYYYKKTTDMLLDVAIPSFTGYAAPERNAGTMNTRGWEVKVGWNDQIGDFTYGLSFNISDYKSVMGDLGGKHVISGGTIITEGEEYLSWYGYKSDGLFQTQDEISSSALLVTNTKPGDIKYVDVSGVDGTPDGIINETYDRVVLGSSLPHFLYGGSVNLGWKGISLSVLFNGVGKQLSRLTETMIRPFASQWLSVPSVMVNSDGTRNYWSTYNTDEQNLKAKYPRYDFNGAEYNNYKVSDFWLVDSSYLRIKNINLGYTFPKSIINRLNMKGLRVYFNVDDPFCFDNYLKGWDPEAGASSYIARTWTFGIDLKF